MAVVKWLPNVYASRSMYDCETRYSQIEKEALALTWACDRFTQYITGVYPPRDGSQARPTAVTGATLQTTSNALLVRPIGVP